MDFDKYINSLKSNCDMLEWSKNKLLADIDKVTKVKKTKEETAINTEKALALINETSKVAREKAVKHLEDIVTNALQYIHEEKCRFAIELGQERGVPAARFYVVTEVNGEESYQDPQDACGGGFVDVISTVLRYAYIKANNDIKTSNVIILDEPGKCVSSDASVKFAEFIKKIGELFDKQTIMVTHNSSLENIADKTLLVNKVRGTSNIVNQIDVDILKKIGDIDYDSIEI